MASPRRFSAKHDPAGERFALAKPEWGAKRICNSCGTRFYDLMRDPIVCPSCGAEFDPEALLRTRRSRSVVSEREPVAAVVAETPEPEVAEEEAAVVEAEVEEEADQEDAGEAAEAGEGEEGEEGEEEGEEEEEDLIEDASELGEDEDDMAEVIDQVDPEDER
jgi:uncharacterized protein (TIGR02300 family)